MDTFYAKSSTPLASSSVVIEETVTPILPILSHGPQIHQTINHRFRVVPDLSVAHGLYGAPYYNSIYYGDRYESGIGESRLAQRETNIEIRYKFLDKWLFGEFREILKMLKVDGNFIKVIPKNEIADNDISKDTEADLIKKSDFIGMEILTLRKNKKILDALCEKNNFKYYDLLHKPYEEYVRKAQNKYVRKQLEKMQK